MNWILQHKDFGLGNFINLTPTLQAIHKLTGEKVKVYFESDYVRDAFYNAYFIEMLEERPDYPPLFTSGMINKVIPDWMHVYYQVRKMYYPDLPENIEFHTFVQSPKYAVIFNGCATVEKSDSKIVDKKTLEEIYLILKDKGYYTTVLGGGNDENWLDVTGHDFDWWAFNDMRESIYQIKLADIVIGNDTGLMHAAGAMKKDCFVMWKDTLLKKNQSPNKNAFYSMKGNWINDFKEWMYAR